MIKQIRVLIIVAGMLFLTSCSVAGLVIDEIGRDDTINLEGSRTDMINSREEMADIRIEQLLLILSDKDIDSMKALFSQKALEEIEDYDSDFSYLISFYEGDVKSCEEEAFSSERAVEYDNKTIRIYSIYKVETENDKYIFFIVDFPEDSINPDNEGLYTLRVIKANDKETEFTYWQDMEIAGIYNPEK